MIQDSRLEVSRGLRHGPPKTSIDHMEADRVGRRERSQCEVTRSMLLGVDGGGTSTEAWLAEPGGAVLGRGASGPSNAKAVGLEAARRALEAAIRAAFDDAGIEPAPVDAACLGLAGFDRPDDRAILAGWADQARVAPGWCWSTTATSWSRPGRPRAGASA